MKCKFKDGDKVRVRFKTSSPLHWRSLLCGEEGTIIVHYDLFREGPIWIVAFDKRPGVVMGGYPLETQEIIPSSSAPELPLINTNKLLPI